VAATVEFNMPLAEAIPINVYGAYRMLQLAQGCKNLESFVHVSTGYANCEKPPGSFIKEEIYDLDEDPEALIEKLMRMPEQTLIAQTPQILGKYPNTYTFTKSMSERILKKYRGSTPLAIVRPTIIASSYKQPAPGWIDTLAAAGGFVSGISVGIVNTMMATPNIPFDVVPVDYVCNAILAAAWFNAKKNELRVIHMASTH